MAKNHRQWRKLEPTPSDVDVETSAAVADAPSTGSLVRRGRRKADQEVPQAIDEMITFCCMLPG